MNTVYFKEHSVVVKEESSSYLGRFWCLDNVGHHTPIVKTAEELMGLAMQLRQVIPTCTLRGHSKMGKIGHGVKKLRIVLKSLQLVTKGINHGIKGGKDTVRKSFFP